MKRNRRLVPVACAIGLLAGLVIPATFASAADGSSIASGEVEVVFDTANGLPSRYAFAAWSNASLRGHDIGSGGGRLAAASRDSSGGEFSGTDSLRLNRVEKTSATTAKVFYDAYWSDGTTRTASLAIQYVVTGTNVDISLQNVTETPGYQLISVNLPSLLTVREEDGGAPWVLDANGGGRLNPLANVKMDKDEEGNDKDHATKPQFVYTPEGYNSPYYPVDGVGTTAATGSLELTGFLDETFASVYFSGSKRHYTAGVGAQYRVRGGTSTPNILVNQPEIARLTFAGDYDKNGVVDWLDLAKRMRDQAPVIPSHYYDDKFVYQVLGQLGHRDAELKYAAAERLAGRVSNLLDGNPQVMQMAGIFEGGHDTIEPNWTQPNGELGGLSGWKTAKANAANLYNTNLTSDDNYDDQYKSKWSCNKDVPSACQNDDDITRTIDNNLQTFNAWNGVDTSYIAGMKKYVDSGRALARADGTITTVGLHDGALIDAMTWWSHRHDWDPAHPASAVDNLTGGKFKILEEYARYGVAVNGEMERYPFLGKVALTVDGPQGGGWVGGPETEVPFMATVLRHTQIYGGTKDDAFPTALESDPKAVLLHNVRSARWIDGKTRDQDIADAYYLGYRPWMLLSKLDVDTFSRSDDKKSITETLKDGSGNTASITINYEKNEFSAVYNGTKIMDGYSVTVPMDSNRIAFYSRTDQKL
ncbi:hypothetical protein, partial [Streptomyces sp. NRRL WC-3742]|uniref:hypothetical protein n=1 Tax=Streptomyces sp. NRRL WC-3742 TaxID=1463934 RepID=UPI0004CAADC7